jgi:hypothetical protein
LEPLREATNDRLSEGQTGAHEARGCLGGCEDNVKVIGICGIELVVSGDVEDYTTGEGNDCGTGNAVSQESFARKDNVTYNPPIAKIEINANFCFRCIFMLDIRTAGRITRIRSETPLMMPVIAIASLPNPSFFTVSVV